VVVLEFELLMRFKMLWNVLGVEVVGDLWSTKGGDCDEADDDEDEDE